MIYPPTNGTEGPKALINCEIFPKCLSLTSLHKKFGKMQSKAKLADLIDKHNLMKFDKLMFNPWCLAKGNENWQASMFQIKTDEQTFNSKIAKEDLWFKKWHVSRKPQYHSLIKTETNQDCDSL